jgi:hypothetical protein
MRSVVNRSEEEMKDAEKEEQSVDSKRYGCDILLEKTTLEKARNSSFPMDAYLVYYLLDDKKYLDLCRSQKVSNIFDMYYDTYGSGAIQKIEFGSGRINPNVWGYKQSDKKKKR